MAVKPWTDFDINNVSTSLNNTCNKNRGDAAYVFESNNIITFDIECSSAWLDENYNLIPYTPFKPEEYWNSMKCHSLCYHWQCSVDGIVYVGRELSDFRLFLDKFKRDTHYIIFVHNLSYELQFLLNAVGITDVFARDTHKAMKCFYMQNIEFRCSYFLTRFSLETWGKELGVPKLVGNLDYRILRTPNTVLTQDEIDYCEMDCIIVHKGIEKFRQKYGSIVDIPLTQTGEIRKVIKTKVMHDKPVKDLMKKLVPENVNMYRIMKKAFMGGYTHANFKYANTTIRTKAGSHYDFISSYPAVMCSEKFPMTPFKKSTFNSKQTDKYAYLMNVRFTGVKAITDTHYIPVSKCNVLENSEVDNGRIISADLIEMWMTEQDYEIIMMTYEFSVNPVVLECYRSRKQYLPKLLVEYTLELFSNKTMYKGVSGKEEIYVSSKQHINSLFGMCVTDIINDIIELDYDDDNFEYVWNKELVNSSSIDEELDKLKANNKAKYFLAYQFGLWITAYARRNLFDCIIPNDKYNMYDDTDSAFFPKKIDFTWYNTRVDYRIDACCNFHKINPSLARPVDKHGTIQYLGHFTEEDEWTEFKTLGAKRYCVRESSDNQLHLTVSGISKQAVICLKDNIDNFNSETVFDKDYWETFCTDVKNGKGEHYNILYKGLTLEDIMNKFKVKNGTKNAVTYVHNDPVLWNKGCYDEYYSNDCYGIVMRPTSYSMGMTYEYALLLDTVSKSYVKVLDR